MLCFVGHNFEKVLLNVIKLPTSIGFYKIRGEFVYYSPLTYQGMRSKIEDFGVEDQEGCYRLKVPIGHGRAPSAVTNP